MRWDIVTETVSVPSICIFVLSRFFQHWRMHRDGSVFLLVTCLKSSTVSLLTNRKTRFDTYEQVEHYCYLVASAVGLACLHIWEFDDPMPIDSAIDCGLAFQFTNILRDISEDAQRGRIYLPRQHYEQHGLSEDDLLSPRPDDRLCCLIAEEIQRTSKLFDSGWQIWDSLHPDGRPMFSMMWRTYRLLLPEDRRRSGFGIGSTSWVDHGRKIQHGDSPFCSMVVSTNARSASRGTCGSP